MRKYLLYYQLYLLKIKNYQIQTIIGANLSYIGFSGISSFLNWLRILAEYDMLKPTIFFKNFIFIDFHVNLTHFFLSISRDRNIRCNSHGYRSTSQMLGFSLYPLSFSCTVPLSIARLTSFSVVFWLSLLI